MRTFFERAGTFLAELRRRRVYRVLALYAVVAVGGLEVADLLIPATTVPPWADELFLGLAIVGLPLVLVLTWTFDVTDRGVERTPDSGRAPSRDVAGDPTVVAILPFENLSGSAEAEPFAVGLHDDLLTELSRASALTVISRGSVRAYRDADRPLREIARELGAGTVVQGGVQMAGSRVRLNILVADAGSDAHRWAKRYDRELTAENIFDLQTELASRIMSEVSAELTSEERARAPLRPTEDLAAYRLYVRGRSLQEQWSEENLRKAVDYFRRAIDTDPEYALAWSGLADAQSLLRWYALPTVDGAPSPEEAAERALELDPELAEARLSHAIVLSSSIVRDAPAALGELERAVALQPSLAAAHIWMSWLHLLVGRPVDALVPAERAVELDPLSPPARVFLAEAYLANGRVGEALDEAVHGREIQPDHPMSHFMEALVLHHLGRHDDVEDALDRTRALVPPHGRTPTHGQIRALRAASRAVAGREAGARELLRELDPGVEPVSRGLVHAALGETEEALDVLETVEEWGQLSNEYLRYFFPGVLGALRDDPRYARLLERADATWGVGP